MSIIVGVAFAPFSYLGQTCLICCFSDHFRGSRGKKRKKKEKKLAKNCMKMQNNDKNCLFKNIYFQFPNFLMINVHANLRNHKSFESGLRYSLCLCIGRMSGARFIHMNYSTSKYERSIKILFILFIVILHSTGAAI